MTAQGADFRAPEKEVQILPAIDLQHGQCVRLVRGDFGAETVFDTDPTSVARRWVDQGAVLLHVVDLDGARRGSPVQMDVIREMAVQGPIQVGGGLRTQEDVDAALQFAQRAVIGTAALDPRLVGLLVDAYGDRLVVALDTREGKVAVQGWTHDSHRSFLEMARELIALGVQRFLHTDVNRDGTMTSPNFESLGQLVSLGPRVIASGGISRIEHVVRLRELGADEVVIGRALYEGTIAMSEALQVAG